MHGMYNIFWFDDFSTKDLSKFKDSLIQWANQNGSNAVMAFDKQSFGNMVKNDKHNSFSVHEIYLPGGITIEFICISTDMCVLRKITKGADVLYHIPESWKGCNFWYAFPSSNGNA